MIHGYNFGAGGLRLAIVIVAMLRANVLICTAARQHPLGSTHLPNLVEKA
jgi:hypothetical protein